MAVHGVSRDAPVRSAMAMLGDRWSTLILLVLADSKLRHTELKSLLIQLSSEQSISQRILTQKLRRLERDGFVSRLAESGPAPKVTYDLTELGRSFHAQLRRLIDWINSNETAIRQSRVRYEESNLEDGLRNS